MIISICKILSQNKNHSVLLKVTRLRKKLVYIIKAGVIPSVLLSFLPCYCHSFHIIVIPSKLLSFQIFVILNSSCTLPYLKGEKIRRWSWPYLRVSLKHVSPWIHSLHQLSNCRTAELNLKKDCTYKRLVQCLLCHVPKTKSVITRRPYSKVKFICTLFFMFTFPCFRF